MSKHFSTPSSEEWNAANAAAEKILLAPHNDNADSSEYAYKYGVLLSAVGLLLTRPAEYRKLRAEVLRRLKPKAKCHIHQNIWGNVNGYIGARKVKEFGNNITRRELDEWIAERKTEGHELGRFVLRTDGI